MKKTTGKSKSNLVPVNLDNYPALKGLLGKDKEAFLKLMRTLFTLADACVASGKDEEVKKYFNQDLGDFIWELVDAVLDVEDLLGDISPEMATLIEIKGLEVHPLARALNNDYLYNKKGDPISVEEKFGLRKDELSIKNLIRQNLYFMYFMDMKSVAQAIQKDDYALIDDLKKPYIQRLLKIQPALEKQNERGILLGKLIPETGFFDVGMRLKEISPICPVCGDKETIFKFKGQYYGCTHCHAGFREG